MNWSQAAPGQDGWDGGGKRGPGAAVQPVRAGTKVFFKPQFICDFCSFVFQYKGNSQKNNHGCCIY